MTQPPDNTENVTFYNPSFHGVEVGGEGWGQFIKTLAWNLMKCLDLQRNVLFCKEDIFHYPLPMGSGGVGEWVVNFQKTFMAWNLMKCPNLLTRSCSPTLHPMGFGGPGSKSFLARNGMKCSGLHRKLICAHYYHHGGNSKNCFAWN